MINRLHLQSFPLNLNNKIIMVPGFLSNFSDKIVGYEESGDGPYRMTTFYLSGTHNNLMEFPSLKFHTGLSGPETSVSVCHIAPI
jgi:hypothetical protein